MDNFEIKLKLTLKCIKQCEGYEERCIGYANKTMDISFLKGYVQLLNQKSNLEKFSYWIYKRLLWKSRRILWEVTPPQWRKIFIEWMNGKVLAFWFLVKRWVMGWREFILSFLSTLEANLVKERLQCSNIWISTSPPCYINIFEKYIEILLDRYLRKREFLQFLRRLCSSLLMPLTQVLFLISIFFNN